MPLRDLHIIECKDREMAVAHILQDWQRRNGHLVVNYLYYSNFVAMGQDGRYRGAMAISDYILIDGIGMQLYLKMVKGYWPFNLNGTDLNPIFVKRLDELKVPIAFYGTTKENIYQAVKNVSTYLQNRSIYYKQDGYSPLNWSKIKPGSALMIGMGSPLQENWVDDNLALIEQKGLIVITVGGFFDFASGFYIRAPKKIRKLKLEWAWRTLLHPRRHFKKRMRDLTILFKPILDLIMGRGKRIQVKEIK